MDNKTDFSDKYVCFLCEKNFSTRPNLLKHARNVHKVEPATTRCFSCDSCATSNFSTLEMLLRHHEVQHNFTRDVIQKSFSCIDGKHTSQMLKIKCKKNVQTKYSDSCHTADFITWKEQEEKTSNAHFVKSTGAKRLPDGTVKSYFLCHRTGIFKPEGTGKRQLKSQGSCKIGKHCFSSMTLSESNGKIKVAYQKNHHGHQFDVGHLRLNARERAAIAGQLLTASKEGPYASLLRALNCNQVMGTNSF